jgi:hypothetical protein
LDSAGLYVGMYAKEGWQGVDESVVEKYVG